MSVPVGKVNADVPNVMSETSRPDHQPIAGRVTSGLAHPDWWRQHKQQDHAPSRNGGKLGERGDANRAVSFLIRRLSPPPVQLAGS